MKLRWLLQKKLTTFKQLENIEIENVEKGKKKYISIK